MHKRDAPQPCRSTIENVFQTRWHLCSRSDGDFLPDPIIEDLVIAARVSERHATDDGVRYTLDEAADELGITLP